MSPHQHSEPAEEEDISRAGVYHDDTEPSTAGSKGKQRADPFSDDAGDPSEDEDAVEKGYPPTTDEAAEARRVEEVRY